MATKVLFLLEGDGNILAYFPQLNYNKKVYGNDHKIAYSSTEQHVSCTVYYSRCCKAASLQEYQSLWYELQALGYNCNPCSAYQHNKRFKHINQ